MEENHSIVLRVHSGLGNQMFQYAFGLALSNRTGQKLLLDTSFYPEIDPLYDTPQEFQLDLFNLDYDVADPAMLQRLTRDLHPKPRRALNKLLKKNGLHWRGPSHVVAVGNAVHAASRLKIERDTYLNGYWASECYFRNCKDKIRDSFTLKDEYLKEADTYLLEQLRQSNSIGIHVRRGAYLDIDYFYNLSMDYYNKAIEYIKLRVRNPLAFIFTDDPEWVRNNIRFDVDTIYTGGNTPGYLDMYYMSQCKHNIIANSTFSWWGAYLNRNGDKIVVAPRIWTNNTKAQKKIDKDNILYPEDWIRL